MSIKLTEKVKCPSCGNEIVVEKYNSINVSLDYELKEKLVNGELTNFKCTCGHSIKLKYPLLYHKMGFKNIMLQYTESDIDTTKKQYEQLKSYFNSILPQNPLHSTIKKSLEQKGEDMQDVFEVYNDWEKFIERVKQIG